MNKLALIFALGAVCSAQEKAKITVYAPGGAFRGGLYNAETMGIGHQNQQSRGFVFDGDHKLALITPDRFVTFEVAAGSHDIAASTKHDKDNFVAVDARPGQHYFVRLTVTSKGASFIQAFKYHMDAVTCEEARKEADSAKPLDAKKVEKDVRNEVVEATYFPRCQ